MVSSMPENLRQRYFNVKEANKELMVEMEALQGQIDVLNSRKAQLQDEISLYDVSKLVNKIPMWHFLSGF